MRKTSYALAIVCSSVLLTFVAGFIVYKGALTPLGEGMKRNSNYLVEWVSFDATFFRLFRFASGAIVIPINPRANTRKERSSLEAIRRCCG